MNRIRKKLIKDRKFNPFNDHFDVKAIREEILKIITEENLNEEDFKLINTSIVAIILHQIFNETYDYLKKNIVECNLLTNILFQYCLSYANRQFLILGKRISKDYFSKEEHLYEDMFKVKIDSTDSSMGRIDPKLALESGIDALHTLFNFANYLKKDISFPFNQLNELKTIGRIARLNIVSQFLYVLKSEYDDSIWNQGYATFYRDHNKITFNYLDTDQLILQKIGFFRLQRNVFGVYLTSKETLKNDTNISRMIVSSFSNKKKPKRIKKAFIEDGYIKYELGDGIDKHELDDEIKNSSEFIAYYNFIDDVDLPNLDNLTLNDILIIFNIVQHLFKRASEIEINNNEVYKLADFDKFPYKISASDLRNYLIRRTCFNVKQINQFLELLTNKEDKRINFWDYPFIKTDKDYIFPLITIVNPITMILSDKWLEDGGFDIDQRGPYFEKYLKETIRAYLSENKFEFLIPDESIIRISKSEYEEVDLLINLKSICVIAELKCIKYALEPRDEHNALKRLQDGAKQVKRKANFITKNSEHLKGTIGDIKGKKIVKLVITNFPTFTGYIFDDIPIVDYFLLEAYINSGKISNHRLVTKDGEITENINVSEEIFYNTEKEFCENFLDCMQNPPAIEKLKPFIQLKMNKISLDFINYDIYVEAAEFKE